MKFLNTSQSEFFSELRRRVDTYFEEHSFSRHANFSMVLKTVCMLGLLYIPYALIVADVVSLWLMPLLVIVMGVGIAGIGMNIMHDANHGAYSPRAWINHLFGYTINLVGGNAFTWKLQHNILHHTYTNIHNHDEDLHGNFLLRFSTHAPLLRTQRHQHRYAFLLYGLLTLNWALAKDFVQLIQYQRRGLRPHARSVYVREWTILIVTKAIFFTYILVIPLAWTPLTWWQVSAGFLIMQGTTGFILSLIFQLAHVVESTGQPLPAPDGNMQTAWAVHQLQTTANFAPRNKALSWYIGGLNYQVEHHLFYGICHVHYPALSRIVKKAAADFHIRYIEYPTFFSAVASHLRTLKRLGRGESLVNREFTEGESSVGTR